MKKYSKYRLYKMLDGHWAKTSYIGDRETIMKIWRSLSTSNIYLFDVRIETEILWWKRGKKYDRY